MTTVDTFKMHHTTTRHAMRNFFVTLCGINMLWTPGLSGQRPVGDVTCKSCRRAIERLTGEGTH